VNNKAVQRSINVVQDVRTVSGDRQFAVLIQVQCFVALSAFDANTIICTMTKKLICFLISVTNGRLKAVRHFVNNFEDAKQKQ